MQILSAVENVNEIQKTVLMEKIDRYFKKDIKDKVFALWGLSFKPGTNDMRESPAVDMIDALIKRGAKIQAHDPEAMQEASRIFKDVKETQFKLFDKRYECLEGADGLVVMTEWNQFREPDFYLIKEMLRFPVIFDGRNLYQPSRLRSLGIDYYCIGRSSGQWPISKSYSI